MHFQALLQPMLKKKQVDGVDFFFASKAAMRAQQAAGEFLEIAPVNSLHRGRPLPKRRSHFKNLAKRGSGLDGKGRAMSGPLWEGDEDEELEEKEAVVNDDETDTYLYGTSIDTVRNVAAMGKLCVMGVDEQGVSQLQVCVVSEHSARLCLHTSPNHAKDCLS
jgi:guanylate kinase